MNRNNYFYQYFFKKIFKKIFLITNGDIAKIIIKDITKKLNL